MSDRFDGTIELVGGPLDGQQCAVSLPDDEKDTIFFDAVAYPLPVNVFPSQVILGMRLFKYCWDRFEKEVAYYRYIGSRVVSEDSFF